MSRSTSRLSLFIGSVAFAFGSLAAVEAILVWLDVAPPPRGEIIRPGEGIPGAEDALVWDRDLLFRFGGGLEFLGFYATNSLGYRGSEFSESNESGAFRIAFVGDSCTFGLGLREEETVPRRVERALNRAFDGVVAFEALNFGVVGYSTFQSAVQVEVDVARFRPDLVVFTPTAFNDATYAPERTDEERSRDHRSIASTIRRSRLSRILGLSRDRYPLPKRIELATDRGPAHCRVPTSDVARLARRAIGAAREAGARVLVAIPTLDERLRTKDPGLEERLAIFAEVARTEGAGIAPVGAALRAFEPLSLFQDGVHPDRDGARTIARVLFGALVESELLPESPRRSFLRSFLEQSRRGCFSRPDLERGFLVDAPKEIAALLDLVIGRAGANSDSRIDDLFARFDPVVGTERSHYGSARALVLEVLEMQDVVIAPSVAARDAWIAEVERNVWPRDLFARHLWGEIGLGATPSRDAISRARTTTIFEHWLDLAEVARDRRLGVAKRALASGDTNGFFAALERVVALDGENVEARVLRARVRRALQRADLAKDEIEIALRLAPDDAGALSVAALLALDENDSARARPLLERAIEVDPFAVDCRFGLARLLMLDGDRDGARRHLSTVLAIDPDAYPEAEQMWQALGRDR